MHKSSSLTLAVLLLAASSAWAGEAQISVNDVARQRAPVALLENDGTARVIWENTKFGILSRVVPVADPASAATEETLLVENTHLSSIPGEGIVVTHRQPIALSDGEGGFWLIWIRQRDYVKAAPFWETHQLLSQEIRRRHFNLNGEPVGAEGVVAWSGTSKSEVSAAPLTNGGFVVAWTSSDNDDATIAREGIFARWFDRDGAPVGPSTRVSAVEDADLAAWPSLTVDAAGRVLFLWHAPDGSSTGIFGRIFDADRKPLDAPQRLNLDPVGEQKRPAAVALENGGYIVLWQGLRHERLKTSIYLQTLDATGRPLGAERKLSSGRLAYEMGPAIARTPRDTYFVSWVVWDESFPREIRGVEIGADGQLADEEMLLNSAPLNTQYRANLFGSEATGLFAIWEGFLEKRAGINGRPLAFLANAPDTPGRLGRPTRPN